MGGAPVPVPEPALDGVPAASGGQGHRLFRAGPAPEPAGGGRSGRPALAAGGGHPPEGIARGVITGILFFFGAVAIAQRCCRGFFGAYFQFGFLTEMTGQVAGDFLSTALSVMLRNLWFFPWPWPRPSCSASFEKSWCRFRNKRETPLRRHKRIILAAVLLATLQMANLALCYAGDDHRYYTVDYSANSAIPRFRAGEHPCGWRPSTRFSGCRRPG